MQAEGLTVEAIQQQLQQHQLLCAQLEGKLALAQMQSTSSLLEPTKSISQKEILEVDQIASPVASKRTISESSQDSSLTSAKNQKKAKLNMMEKNSVLPKEPYLSVLLPLKLLELVPLLLEMRKRKQILQRRKNFKKPLQE